MPFAAGDKLGHYEVLSLLGQGGMGEVYRARDTTLKRDVALKVLPATFLRDPERMARFQREAEVLASLEHPNIGHIHGIVDAADSRALVLALIEGPTLADRIEAGSIPQDEAVAISKQIIEALEYAHDRGVVHRDLKPANIKITPDGVVKVLDFGLAKVLDDEPAASALGNSPTLTLGHTRAGVILSTAAYMSPEQAVGRPVDRRSDIFSFGAVVYEMLTGKRAFAGATTPDVLEAVVKSDPDWSSIPAGTPASIRQLLNRCLTKERKQRLQAVGEARIVLDSPSGTDVPLPAEARSGSRVPWVVAAFLAIAVTGLAWVAYRHTSKERPRPVKLSLLPPEKGTFQGMSVSPDGRRLAFTALVDGKAGLWVRDLEESTPRLLVGTEGARGPFWSPDSRWIAFYADRKLKKIEASGGPISTLCDSGVSNGGTWNKDGVIVFTPNSTAGIYAGLFRVSAAGGTPTSVTALDRPKEVTHWFPWFLPDGRHFLYSVRSPDKDTIYVGDVEAKSEAQAHRVIVAGASDARYVPPGVLLFVRNDTLMAQAFNASKVETSGEAVPVGEQVSRNNYAVSENGVLGYMPVAAGEISRFKWFDRSGRVIGTLDAPGMLQYPAISPDGRTVAYFRRDGGQSASIWLHDVARGTSIQFAQGAQFPVWSPDGSSLVYYSSSRSGGVNIFRKSIAGASTDEILAGFPYRPEDWSADGRYIIGQSPSEGIKVLPLFGDRKPFRYASIDNTSGIAKLSPNGRWLAYVSQETRRPEVYVIAFPDEGVKARISTNGGSFPIWSRDGRELYFIAADRKLMAVEVLPNAAKFESGLAKALFETRMAQLGDPWYDVSRDGRFLIPTLVGESASVPITVVLNWQAALKK